jgi:hypothetical protein
MMPAGHITRELNAGAGGVPGLGEYEVLTPAQLAAAWQLSEQSVRRLFQDRPGVFKLGDSNPRGRRGYVTLRIPAAVAAQVWQERTR